MRVWPKVRGMPSSEPLRRPAEWPDGEGIRHKAALVFVVILAVACVPVGFGFARIGLPAAAKYPLLFAVLFLLTAGFGVVTRLRPGHRVGGIVLTAHEDRPATEIRYSKVAFAIVAALVACLAAICALAALDFATAAADIPAAPVGAVLFVLATLFFLSFFALAALGRVKQGRIVLSPLGIHQRGWAFVSFLPWEALAGVKAAYNGTPEILVIAYTNSHWERQQLGGVWKLDRLPPVPMIEIDTSKLAVDPTLVYHLVRFYTDNPAVRTELGTQASLRRALSGSFQ